MNKTVLLPKMALNNMITQKASYGPYMFASIAAIFTYFVFDIVLKSGIMETVPRSVYAYVLVSIGFWLLAIILVPFLYYVNSFLIKRRKKELGLYHILGLEKKHIGVLLFWESLLLYVVVILSSFALGLLFSKGIFRLLLWATNLPADAPFRIAPVTFLDTIVFYAGVMALNLFVNLVQVGKAKPVELLNSAKKGEKDAPKKVWPLAILGALLLGAGYYIAIISKIDVMLFINFFLAIFLVVMGTYFLFTSGSMIILKRMKARKKSYYQAENFITISGLISRMKKSAASLSNICIFSTMVMITLICTVSVVTGIDGANQAMYPGDAEICFSGTEEADRQQVLETVETAAQDHGLELTEIWYMEGCRINYDQVNDTLLEFDRKREIPITDHSCMFVLTLEEFNRMEGCSEKLQDNEVILFSSGPDFGYDHVTLLNGERFSAREIRKCSFGMKSKSNVYEDSLLMVVKDRDERARIAGIYGLEEGDCLLNIYRIRTNAKAKEFDTFYQDLNERVSGKEGFAYISNHRENSAEMTGMYGGLVFIGIFFCTIFVICLLIIMYYKQVAEGFEDKQNFEMMQKVGMSDEEIRRTIGKQVRVVFLLPLIGAIIHTIVGMHMVLELLAVIGFYQSEFILLCTACVCVLFTLIYIFSYGRTAKAYYRIVTQM